MAKILYNEETGWNQYVSGHAESTNYHRFEWKDVIEKTFGHKTFYLSSIDGNNRVTGILPLVHIKSALFGNSIVSMPFFNYGGILSDNEEAEKDLIDSAKQILRDTGAGYIEFRHTRERLPGVGSKKHKVTMLLNLEKKIADQWDLFDPKLRNQIRKSERSGLEKRTGHAEIDNFYAVFSRNMRDLGTPVYPKNLFRNIIKALPKYTDFLTIYLKGKAIAAGLITWHKNTLEMPWASSVREFRPYCPNDLLYWEAIKFGIERSFTKFDFGRSTPDSGTYKFKEQWGAKPIQLYWQYIMGKALNYPDLSPDNPRFKLMIKLWQKTPLWITKIAGPRIVKYIP